MRTYLTILLVSISLTLQCLPITLICQPGYLKCKNKTYILECKDNYGEDCIYHLDLPNGTYVYYSKYDTTTFTVDSGKVKELKPFFKKILTFE